MMPSLLRVALVIGLLAAPGLTVAAAGAEAEKAPAPLPAAPVAPVTRDAPAAEGGAKAPAAAAGPLSDTQRYCSNIAAAAADARFAWQRKQLTDLQAQLKQRIADLEAKEAEFKATMAARDEMLQKANDLVVSIYSKMKPEPAAAQIAALDEHLAAAILAQLSPKQASSILNEIPTEKAAKLAADLATVMPEKKS